MSDMEDLDKQLNSVETKAKVQAPSNLVPCGRYGGDMAADVSSALLGFIPNGLNITYDSTLKKIPFLSTFFSHQWVEEVLKMVLGITIGRGLSRDLGRYVFWPLGFLFGMNLSLFTQKPLKYQGGFGKFLYELSGQTVLGCLVGLVALVIGVSVQPGLSLATLPWKIWGLAIVAGGGIGMMAKTIMLIALEAVTRANAASSRLNAKRAQKLGALLKEQLKEKTHQKVYHHARAMIEQTYGPQLESSLTNFFAHNHDKVCETTFNKIDRHINYLTDRAIHGDMDALKKLFKFYKDKATSNGSVDKMLDRIINGREIFRLKDHVDNLYDRWHYREMIGQGV